MIRLLLNFALMAVVALTACRAQIETPPVATEGTTPTETAAKKRVMVIPVREAIDDPVLFILRRGLKEAIEQKMDAVVLDMDTPGGSLGTTFEILEALEKFPGQTYTFVNKDAISAGAFIAAATHEIYFAPNGVMGAAAPVSGSGQDIDKTMKAKIVSYLKARIRSISEGKGYRGEVISAMLDEASEFKIGDRVLKKKDELLSLTAKEAAEKFGEPPQPLLAAGIAQNIDELLVSKFGADSFVVKKLEVTWSEELAQYLTSIKPLLMGLGLLAIFIELKTPGFGVFGVAGGILLGIVFLSSYVAGLSGHEPLIVFALGVALVALEIFLFPGIVVVALTGVLMILGSLLWAMADLWPNEPISISGDVFVGPAINLMLGLLIAVVLALVFARFIPKGWFFSRLALATPVAGSAQIAGVAPDRGAKISQLLGARGVATTALFPTGQVEIDGRRYEAKVEVGSVAAGTPIVVTRVTDFGLVVEVVS
jgi:membrane-bound serine protease (ClpP class)